MVDTTLAYQILFSGFWLRFFQIWKRSVTPYTLGTRDSKKTRKPKRLHFLCLLNQYVSNCSYIRTTWKKCRLWSPYSRVSSSAALGEVHEFAFLTNADATGQENHLKFFTNWALREAPENHNWCKNKTSATALHTFTLHLPQLTLSGKWLHLPLNLQTWKLCSGSMGKFYVLCSIMKSRLQHH